MWSYNISQYKNLVTYHLIIAFPILNELLIHKLIVVL
jgi:hypothetical protein